MPLKIKETYTVAISDKEKMLNLDEAFCDLVLRNLSGGGNLHVNPLTHVTQREFIEKQHTEQQKTLNSKKNWNKYLGIGFTLVALGISPFLSPVPIIIGLVRRNAFNKKIKNENETYKEKKGDLEFAEVLTANLQKNLFKDKPIKYKDYEEVYNNAEKAFANSKEITEEAIENESKENRWRLIQDFEETKKLTKNKANLEEISQDFQNYKQQRFDDFTK